MDGVIPGVDGGRAAVDDDVGLRFDALGRARGGLAGRGATARGDRQGAAGDDRVGVRVDAVAARGQGDGAVRDVDVALGVVVVLVGLEGVAAGGHGDGAAGNSQGVLAAQTVVRGGGVDRAAQDVQVVLGGDRVRGAGGHGERARPGDRQVHVGVDGGVRVLRAGVGAVGDRRGALERQNEVVTAGRLDRGTRRRGDGRVVENQDNLVLRSGGHDDLAGEGAAELVDAGLGDGQHAVAHAHGVGRGGRGRAAERHVDGVRGLPVAVLHVGGLRVRGQGVGRGGRRGRVAVGSGGCDGSGRARRAGAGTGGGRARGAAGAQRQRSNEGDRANRPGGGPDFLKGFHVYVSFVQLKLVFLMLSAFVSCAVETAGAGVRSVRPPSRGARRA